MIYRVMPPAGVLLIFLCAAIPCLAASCESLAKTALSNTTIATAEAVPAGSFTPPGGQPISKLPAFCRIAGSIKPSADSDIQFEVWLPASGWNGKFQGVGNGGFAGAISFGGMAAAMSGGYATASSDTGHEAGGTDAGWALKHPEKVIDFGYRAVHETADKAKALIRAFYGEAPRRSYFSSCSNGGRQALMEAQRFPADYDGIVAGAPANYWTHLLTAAAWDMKATLAEAGTYIPASKLPAIEAAAQAACDARDGVKDGVIENPARCDFDPGTLLCKGAESDACLTALQVSTLKKIYGGPRDSKGRSVYPGYSPGGEAESGGWGPWITGTAPEKSLMFAFGTQFFKNMVYDDPAWDFRTFDVDRDMKKADAKMAKILNATNPDLKPFEQRGGKLILYHGWSDAAIPAAQRRQLLPERGFEDGSAGGGPVRAPVHGSGNAALWRRLRSEQLRTGRCGPGRRAARCHHGHGTLGRARRRARADHRHEVQGRGPRERRLPHASALRVSPGGEVERYGQHRRRRKLHLRRAVTRPQRYRSRRIRAWCVTCPAAI